MSKLKEFTDANFQNEVIENDRPVLVDFWASWCGPCRAVSPTVEEIARQFKGSVKVGKLNIDEHQQATARFGIHSIPAVLLFKDGEVVATLVGVQPKERYVQAIDKVAA